MAKFNSVFLLAVVSAAIGLVSAVTEDERNNIRMAVLPILSSCGQELGVTKEQVLAAKQNKDLDALDSCYYACFFKKIGVINNDGVFDPSAAKAKNQQYIHGQDDLVKLAAIADKCAAVNDQTVSDGAQGCERSKLLARCLADNKASITPFAS